MKNSNIGLLLLLHIAIPLHNETSKVHCQKSSVYSFSLVGGYNIKENYTIYLKYTILLLGKCYVDEDICNTRYQVYINKWYVVTIIEPIEASHSKHEIQYLPM